jgi:HAD superfamily phosphoserine phosphatase-like hydrolase
MKEKYAIFDFCDTLVKGQSLQLFCYFRCNKNLPYFLYFKIINWIYEIGFLRVDIKKALLLKIFKGLSKQKYEKLCEEFYNVVLRTIFIDRIKSELISAKQNGYKIIILSGGLKDYIKFIQNDLAIDLVIGNELKFNNANKCLGIIDGIDCLGPNKISYLSKNLINKIKDQWRCCRADSPPPAISYAPLPQVGEGLGERAK